MSRFGPDPRSFFDSVYGDIPPWDIGGPQPAMSVLLGEYPPVDPVLDLGCGSGDLSIYLAELGHQTLGVDFVDTAIAHANEKARALPPDVARLLDFRVGDATKPSSLGVRFGSVVDSGFFHLLDPAECDRFVEDLAASLLPGGRYYMHEFAIEFPIENVPRAITEDELRARFNPETGWLVHDIRPAEFLSRVASPTAAIAACFERQST